MKSRLLQVKKIFFNSLDFYRKNRILAHRKSKMQKMKNLNILKNLFIALLIAIPSFMSAQNKVAAANQDAKASLANKKFNLIIHSANGEEGMKDFIVFGTDGFESKAGKSSAALNSRYEATQDEKGTIRFNATIVTSEGMKTYMGTITGNVITGKYIVEPTGQPAVSYALNGTLDLSK
jgi:hypothetical protein